MPRLQTYKKLKEISTKFVRPTMGCDPEIFVMDPNKKDKVIPAFTFLPSKADATENLYWDGFQAEFATRPYMCLDLLQGGLFKQLVKLKTAAKTKGGKLTIQSVIKLDKDFLKKLPSEFVQLGCKPSYNAYGTKSTEISDPADLTTRWAGGHIHFGGMRTPPDYVRLAKVADTILGLWAVGAFQSFDDPIRRKFYGLAGEYRKPKYKDYFDFADRKTVPSYGFEYRTLSNAWLSHPAIFHVTFEIARIAHYIARNDTLYALLVQSALTEQAINNCDVPLAHKLFRNNVTMFKHMFRRIKDMNPLRYVNMALDIEENGIESVIKDPYNVSKNWSLDKFDAQIDMYDGPKNTAHNPIGSQFKELVNDGDTTS